MSMLTPRGFDIKGGRRSRRRFGRPRREPKQLRGMRGGHRWRRRGRGRTLLRALAALVVLAVVAAAGWLGYDRWRDRRDGPAPATPVVAARPTCTPVPGPTAAPARQVRANVYNATRKQGLAAGVGRSLRQ